MPSRRGPTYWVRLFVGWLLVLGWLTLVAWNATPYLRGAAAPPLANLLTRLVTPPGLPLAPDIAALTGWTLAAAVLVDTVVLAWLSLSRPVAVPANPLRTQPASALTAAPDPATSVRAPVLADAAPAATPAPEPAWPASAPAVAAPVAPANRTPAKEAQSDVARHKRQVFISHASRDNAFGVQLVEQLRAELWPDYDVWYDAMGGPGADGLWESGIPPASYWQDEIQKHLMDANVFVVILSPAAIDSPWVVDELGLAWSRKNANPNIEAGLVVVPVLRETCAVPPWLTLIQWVDFTGWHPDGWPDGEQTNAALLSAVRDTRTRARPVELVGPPFDLALLPPLERFIGRERAVEQVIELLTGAGMGQQANVAAANGLGGIGKTALATEVARRLMGTRDFPDGIAVVDCRNQHTQDEAQALLRRALGRFTDGRKEPDANNQAELSDATRKIFAGKRALVIFDNVEGDLPAEQLITPLRGAGCAVLSTSREPLTAVPSRTTLRLDLLPEDEAMELFKQYFGRELTEEEERAAHVIVAALGRHTLATKLAAANAADVLTGRPMAAIAHDLKTRPNTGLLLENGEQAVLYVLESSVRSLSLEARRLFAALAGFAASDVGYMAARAVAEALGGPNPNASLNRLLSLRLADASYLESLAGDDETDRERVRLHPLVRAYASDLFAGTRTVANDPAWTADQRKQVKTTIASWYVKYVNRYNHFDPSRNTLSVLERDEENITGSLEWAIGQEQHAVVVALTHAMRRFWRDRRRRVMADQFMPDAAKVATLQAEDAKSAALLADAVYRANQLAAMAKDAKDAAEENAQREYAADLAFNLGQLYRQTGRLDEAEPYFMQDLLFRKQRHQYAGQAQALHQLAQLERARGHMKLALRYCQHGLSVVHRHLPRNGAYTTQNANDLIQAKGLLTAQKGRIQRSRGNLAEADKLFAEAFMLFEQTGDLLEQSVALAYRGRIARVRGQLEQAQEYFERSDDFARQVHDVRGQGVVATQSGRIALMRGAKEAATRAFEEGLSKARQVLDHQAEVVNLNYLGRIAYSSGDMLNAEIYLGESLQKARQISDRPDEGVNLGYLGRIARKHGLLFQAHEYFSKSLKILREVEDRRDVALVLAEMALLDVDMHHLTRARWRLWRSLRLIRKVGDRRSEGTILLVHGKIDYARGDNAAAQMRFTAALVRARELGDVSGVAEAMEWLNKVAETGGDSI